MARPQEFNTAEVLHKALGVFWHKGYEATSLTDLLKAMGLSKSSLYGTFGSKHELFLHAFDAYREERKREMLAILEQGDAREAIGNFFYKIIADARDPEFCHGCMSINQAVEMAPQDPEVRERVLADFLLIEDALTTAIQRGKKDGSVSNSRKARELAQLLVVTFPGFQVMVRAGGYGKKLDKALALLLHNLD